MSRFLYFRLAKTNIKNNSKTYIPFILSGIGMVMMFYNMNFLIAAKEIGVDSSGLRLLLRLGTYVVAFFSIIFLFYTNSFLIKRRKKEFGLFNILGMEKKHIARIMFLETLIVSFICIAGGLFTGIMFSKLMILLLCKLIGYNVRFGFEIPVIAVVVTAILFGTTYFVILIYNIFQVHLSKPVELLKSGNVGEKEPKTKWISAAIGFISLAGGYYIALTVKTPLKAFNLFFLAVILVIIGTHYLFTAGSVAILKLLRRNKSYYYKAKHFISVSGMIYRMKRNAAGLANICILSTMVIVMLSTTVSLYVGFEDVMRARYRRNIILSTEYISDSQIEKIDGLIEEQTKEFGVEAKNIFKYKYIKFLAYQNDGRFVVSYDYASDNSVVLTILSIDEYNRLMNASESLSSDEALVYEYKGKITGDTLDFNGFKLKI